MDQTSCRLETLETKLPALTIHTYADPFSVSLVSKWYNSVQGMHVASGTVRLLEMTGAQVL